MDAQRLSPFTGETIGQGLLTKILRDIDLGAEQLNEMFH
jgi:hypothetical protein